MSDTPDDNATVVDFDSAKSPHEHARKERRLEGLRSRFNAVLKAARPEAANTRKNKKKKKSRKGSKGKR